MSGVEPVGPQGVASRAGVAAPETGCLASSALDGHVLVGSTAAHLTRCCVPDRGRAARPMPTCVPLYLGLSPAKGPAGLGPLAAVPAPAYDLEMTANVRTTTLRMEVLASALRHGVDHAVRGGE